MTKKVIKIGVFDSGIGGKAVAERLRTLFPECKIIEADDRKNVPYGERRPVDILNMTILALEPLIQKKCDVIVIACNTITTNVIHDLRTHFPSIRFVGIEPMIKPAARITKSGAIGILATPGTLKSERYKALKRQWADRLTVIEPDCHDWASLVERGDGHRIDVEAVVSHLKRWSVDTIVLGCTHYHWLKDAIQAIAGPGVHVLEPSDAIGAQISSLLSTAHALPE